MRIVLTGSHPKLQHGFDAIERTLMLSTEVIAGVLVAAEIVLLLIGVIARYVFRHSLVWSDSLASLLFLWLAMMGAVIAFQRGEHMRMGTFVRAASPRWQPFFQALAVITPLAFLLLVAGPTIDYVLDESHLTDPALNISNAWRAAAMPVGVFLMIASSLFQLARLTHWRPVLGALLLTVLVGGGLAALQPLLAGAGSWNLVLFFIGVVALCVFSGVPIAFSFGLASFGYLSLTTSIPLLVMASRMDQGMSQIVLLAVPLFVILGLLMEMTGMAKALVEFLANLLGHVPGGLSYVLVGAMYLVSGISGSKSADMAALAPVLYPEMRARGTRPGEFVALLSATAAQTETIPPSLVLIILGSVTNTSIGALFTGGLLPGLVVGLMLCALVWWRNRGGRLADGAAFGERRARPTPREIGRSFWIALPALALPFVIRFAVVDGIATATEVSTIGIVYTIAAGLLLYRRFDWRRMWPILVGTAALSGAILLIIGAATSMAWCLTQSGFSDALADIFAKLPGGLVVFVIASIALFIVLGSLLEGIPAIVLFGPLLFPIAQEVGLNPVHYAMIAILAMGMGLFAPPFGVGYYTACAINRINPEEGMRPIVAYMVALGVGVALVAAVPWISTGFL
ncbi:TRAP transporter large permease [Paraburkholderia sp. ZP32-5]|uniref:TRAP transporter large permease n=1 Tax=Paraburkholderia sp. ZP32-5 TaxID=2883245 RepID=UPI001F2A3977|nr:TRAP transporter large permease subunit [Paraburkholderia sp. ZP32-5]